MIPSLGLPALQSPPERPKGSRATCGAQSAWKVNSSKFIHETVAQRSITSTYRQLSMFVLAFVHGREAKDRRNVKGSGRPSTALHPGVLVESKCRGVPHAGRHLRV